MGALIEIHNYFKALRKDDNETFKKRIGSFTKILAVIETEDNLEHLKQVVKEVRVQYSGGWLSNRYANHLFVLENELKYGQSTIETLREEIDKNEILGFNPAAESEDEFELEDFETARSGKANLQQKKYDQLESLLKKSIGKLKKYEMNRRRMLSPSATDEKEKSIMELLRKEVTSKLFNIDTETGIDRDLTQKKVHLATKLIGNLQEFQSSMKEQELSPGDTNNYLGGIYYSLLVTENQHQSIIDQSITGTSGEFSRIINAAKSEIEKISPQGKKMGEELYKRLISEAADEAKPRPGPGPKH